MSEMIERLPRSMVIRFDDQAQAKRIAELAKRGRRSKHAVALMALERGLQQMEGEKQ